jgi:hypothetical protein
LERETRFELATLALARRCSTTELLPLTARLSIPGGSNRVKPLKLLLPGPAGLSGNASLGAQPLFHFDDFTIPHVEDAPGNCRGVGIMRNHEGRLLEFAIRPY